MIFFGYTKNLFSKFLFLLLPLFAMVAVSALWTISQHALHQQELQMTDRVEALAARMGVLLSNPNDHLNPVEIEAHLSLLLSDQAIVCAETISADSTLIAKVPHDTECKSEGKNKFISVDIADGSGAKLRIGISNSEILKLQSQQLNYGAYILGLAVILTTLASWFCFHLIVSKPLSKILAAIQISKISGTLTKIENPTLDELGTLATSFNELQIELDKEAQLNKAALARIDYIYNETPAMMFTINEQGNIISTSDYWLEESGYSRKDVIDKNIAHFLSEDSIASLQKNMNFASNSKIIDDIPLSFRRKNNQLIDITLSGTRDDHDGHKSYLCVMNDVSEFKSAQRRLQRIATTDHLTSLPNRQGLFDFVARLNSQPEEKRNQTAFMFIDLDGFKAVNDTYGHEAGDELLKMVAKRLTKSTKANDFTARLSGDEFIIVLQGLKQKSGIPTIAQRVLDALSAPFEILNHQLNISASIGIADYSHGAKAAEDVLRMADKAMYAAKNQGKNRISIYQPELALVEQQSASLH
jgi:diguanylate cyclase (GGDEF)-like protein/PAS domain S-box-containing protein